MHAYAQIELNPSNVTLDANFLPTGGLGAAGWIRAHELMAFVLCAAWTGTPQGNFFLEGTFNHPVKGDTATAIPIPANRIFVVSGSIVPAGGAAGQNAWERASQSGFPYLRLNYQWQMNSGTLSYVSAGGPALRDS